MRIESNPRLRRGDDLLTEHYGPDWPERIDWLTLDMESVTWCLLAQLAGNYLTGRVDLFGLVITRGCAQSPGPSYYGLDLLPGERPDNLTRRWREYVYRTRSSRLSAPEAGA